MDTTTKINLCKKYAPTVFSISNLARKLGIKPVGGNSCCLKRFCHAHNIDISHFTGQGWAKGSVSTKRKCADEILIVRPDFSARVQGAKLKRALIEKGVSECCSICKLETWLDQKIPLEVDHINQKYWDCRFENLRLLCPNCHFLATYNLLT